MERERLGSRLGFILLSAGCAIGCGNVWKFPWMCGQYGGGGFVLLYILCLLVLGLPVMTMEFAVGRAAQASPIHMYQKIERPGQKWHWHGYVSFFGNVALMAFYTVVTGWIINYFVRFLTGQTADIGFVSMIRNPGLNVTYLAITVVLAFGILCFHLQGGLERITKVMMTLLLVLMIVLAIHSFTLPGAKDGIAFYLVPNMDNVRSVGLGNVIAAAMNQAFFTLSLGIAAMEIFGSYMSKDHTLLSEGARICGLDTFVAVMAGIIIFPACFSYGVEVTSGPSLIFVTLPNVFTNMAGGRVWGSLFFLFMTFASFSTVIAVIENIMSSCMDLFGWSRKKAALINGVIILIASVPCVLGYNVLSDFHPIGGRDVLDSEDFLVSSILLPLGSLIYLLFCVTRWGWGFKNYQAEANAGKGMKVAGWMRWLFMIVLPLMILAIFIIGLTG